VVGNRFGVGRETLDLFDDFKPLSGCKAKEGRYQSQAFDGLVVVDGPAPRFIGRISQRSGSRATRF
jgi:hypothetical protein